MNYAQLIFLGVCCLGEVAVAIIAVVISYIRRKHDSTVPSE